MRCGSAGSVGAEGEGQDERVDSPDAPGVCAVFLLPVLRMVPRCDDRPGSNRRAENAFATGLEEATYAARSPAVGASVGIADAEVAEKVMTMVRMVCCAGWLGRSLPGWKRIASGFGAMSSSGRASDVAWRDII